MQIMQRHKSKCDIFMILFYTDGGAAYPATEIGKIKTLGVNFKFYGLCDGPTTSEFTRMT
jgi:hypothetical protein